MYFNADGTKYVGWLPYNGNWYYISDNGYMVADTIDYCVSQDAFRDENGNTNWTEYNKARKASPRYVFDAMVLWLQDGIMTFKLQVVRLHTMNGIIQTLMESVMTDGFYTTELGIISVKAKC